MLKCASLYTLEIDNHVQALYEIREQLKQKIALMKSTIGVVMCHPEFISSGVLEYICENIPFDLVGITTSSQAVNGKIGETILTVFVMTSDDIQFITGVTDSLIVDVDKPVRTAYEEVMKGISEVPTLALLFPPFTPHSGDSYIRAMGKITPRTALFGALSIDDTATFKNSKTIYKGKTFECEMAFVLCVGNINPRFLLSTVSNNADMSQSIPVTKANGKYVYEIDGTNAFEYFVDIGLIDRRGSLGSFQFIPIKVEMMKRNDKSGVPVIRGLDYFMENGTAVFHGDVEEGANITILKCDVNDILFTANHTIRQMNKLQNINGAMIFPCAVRHSTLASVNTPTLELQTALSEINPQIPFMMGYSGGEICPTSFYDGIPVNRYHSYSLIIMVV